MRDERYDYHTCGFGSLKGGVVYCDLSRYPCHTPCTKQEVDIEICKNKQEQEEK